MTNDKKSTSERWFMALSAVILLVGGLLSLGDGVWNAVTWFALGGGLGIGAAGHTSTGPTLLAARVAIVSGYHQQARVENAFFRYKSIIGNGLRARSPAGQGSEAVLACNILNRMTELGRPASYRIGL